MTSIRAEASADINADPPVVYDILSDYRQGHPSILPSRYFTFLDVEQGGRGAGTIIRFGMKVMGRVSVARAEVAEPEPGRVLTETILDRRGLITTFTVDPLAERRSRVTIVTSWIARGLGGLVEGLLAPRVLGRIYREELALLEQAVSSRPAASSTFTAGRSRGGVTSPSIPAETS